VTKAYTTRVGSGPFPTEDTGEVGEALVERGQEYGTTTGRRRRCGWFDAVLARYAARLNGFTDLFLTKLDVLSGLSPLKVCVGYRLGDETYDEFPPHQSIFHRAEPVYEEMEGWWEDIQGARSYGDLPAAARKYLERLQDLAGVPVSVVSVGPSREQSLVPGELEGGSPR
jgi:adenylosuccinate synthase